MSAVDSNIDPRGNEERFFELASRLQRPDETLEDWAREIVGKVSIKPPITVQKIDPTETLRRFIDLPKLLDLLLHRRLMLPRLERLMEGDPFECSARRTYDGISREKLLERIKNLQTFVEKEYEAFLSIESRNEYIKRDLDRMSADELRDALWHLEQTKLKQYLRCLCWYQGETDSDAMWKIYAKEIGVAIVTSCDRLTQAVETCNVPKVLEPHFNLTLAAVEYSDSDNCGASEPWLIKRRAFGHEKEARLFAHTPFMVLKQYGFALKIDLEKMIEEIQVTPFATWQYDSIKAIIDRLTDGKIKVSQSKHRRAPKSVWPRPTQKVDQVTPPIAGSFIPEKGAGGAST
jgi:hypothetical protein